ncbi:MAG: hypothetical protein RJA99_5094 [Pseudomonadota bacterium]|jgi:pimeloyl-ACP methyl ester carboxylesterase
MTARRSARPRLAVLLARVVASLAGCGHDPNDSVPLPPTAVGGDALVAPIAAPQPAWLTETMVVAVLTKAEVDAATASRGWAALAGPARCDVTLHAILHPTAGPKGEATDASGAVLVPGGAGCPGPYPLLSYSRGTDLDRSRTMAKLDDRETQEITAFFAARGYVVVASDYLGYGRSSFPYHPYLHAESAARTGIDALRAARTLLARLGVAESDRVFLTGYSQGGHAALAIERAIERDAPVGVPAPVATGAMSGPYDLAGTFTEGVQLLPLLSVSLSGSVARTVAIRLGDVLGTGAAELLAAQSGLREVLAANSVIGWRPAAPVLLCGGSRDPIVPFSNTLRAADDFRARGATLIVVDVEQEPALEPMLPPADVPIEGLGSYHQGAVPPLCFAVVRDRLLEPRR